MAVPSYTRLSTSLLPQLRHRNFAYGDFIPPKDLKTAAELPLLTVINNVYFFPLSWRKLLVDFCRIQQPIRHNDALIGLAGSVA